MATTSITKPRTPRAKPAPKAEAEVKPAKAESLQQLKNRLRNEAEREVLNKHKDEVIKITEAKYDEHGLEYVRRLSDKEKAAKLIEEQYEKFPELRPVYTVVESLPAPEPEYDRVQYDEPPAEDYADVEGPDAEG